MNQIITPFMQVFFLLLGYIFIFPTPYGLAHSDLLDESPSRGLTLRHDLKVPIGTLNGVPQHTVLLTGTSLQEVPAVISRQRAEIGFPCEVLPSEEERIFQNFPWYILRNNFIHSPMPGRLVQMRTHKGEIIRRGENLAVVEAMKMEMVLRSPFHGTIKCVFSEEGEIVDNDSALISLLPFSAEWEDMNPNAPLPHKAHLRSFFPWAKFSVTNTTPPVKEAPPVEEQKAEEKQDHIAPHASNADVKDLPKPLPLVREASKKRPGRAFFKKPIFPLTQPLRALSHEKGVSKQGNKTEGKIRENFKTYTSSQAFQKQVDRQLMPILQEKPHQGHIKNITAPLPSAPLAKQKNIFSVSSGLKMEISSLKRISKKGKERILKRPKTFQTYPPLKEDSEREDVKDHSGFSLLATAKIVFGLMFLCQFLFIGKAWPILRFYYLEYGAIPLYNSSAPTPIRWMYASDFNQQAFFAKKSLCNTNTFSQKYTKIA